MINEPDIRDERRALWNPIALVDVVLHCCMSDAYGRDRVPSQDLPSDACDERKPVSIFKIGEAVRAHDAVNLCLGLALDVGVGHHGKEE